MSLSFVESGAELSTHEFESILEASGLAEEFHKLDAEHKKALHESFIQMAGVTETHDFVSRVELLKQIINNDKKSALHEQIGNTELRKAAGTGK